MAKKTKRRSLIEAEARMESYLKKIGYTGKYKGVSLNEIPNYKIKTSLPNTSDKVGNGPKKYRPSYTGDELLGISETHKSNAMPIRKDNKQAAIDAAHMRRN
jgi:hypothetical protein